MTDDVFFRLPIDLQKMLFGKKLIKVAWKQNENQVYQVDSWAYLKISPNLSLLRQERANLAMLEGILPIPRILYYEEEQGKAYLLTTKLKGLPACHPRVLRNPEKLCTLLAEALQMFHGVNTGDEPNKDNCVWTHGDFCLPNIMIYRGKISGFIDLGDVSKNDPWVDYAWCIWSLSFNLKTDAYQELLLTRLNIPYDEQKYHQYIDVEDAK